MDLKPVAEVQWHILSVSRWTYRRRTFLLCQSEEALVVILAYKCDFHSAECASFGAGERGVHLSTDVNCPGRL